MLAIDTYEDLQVAARMAGVGPTTPFGPVRRAYKAKAKAIRSSPLGPFCHLVHEAGLEQVNRRYFLAHL